MDKLLLVSPNCGDLAPANLEAKKFPDGESYARVPELKACAGMHVGVLHRCYPNPDSSLFQLLQLVRVLRPVAGRITVIVPYLPYARQDKVFLEGEAPSADIVCQLLRESGVSDLVTAECHFFKRGPGVFQREGLAIDNRTLGPMILKQLNELVEEPVIVSPDLGAAHLAGIGGKAMVKQRGGYVEGDTAFREIKEQKMDFSVKGKDVIIIDDMIAGGGTMARAVKTCKEKGARKIVCGATHGLLLDDAAKKIKAAGASAILTSDSIPNPTSGVSVKLVLEDWVESGKQMRLV